MTVLNAANVLLDQLNQERVIVASKVVDPIVDVYLRWRVNSDGDCLL